MEGRRQANESPYARAWPVSKATYWWMLSLFTTAYKRPLTQDDVYDPIHYLTSNYNYEPFIKEWDKLSLEKKERRGSLFRVLLLHFRFQILRGYVLYFIADSCKLCLFVTLRYLVETLGTGTKGVIPQTSWGLLGIIMLLALTNSLMATNGMRMVRIVELRIKLILGTLVYRKILKLSRKAMRDTNSGQIVSLLSADIEAINLGLAFLYGWFSAPLMVMAVFLYEGLDIGLSCLVGLALLAIVLVIQYQLGETAGKLRLKQAAWTDKRVFLMNEIIKAMKVIKMYCWEKPYANIARKLRRSEMKVQLWRSILVAASMGAGYPVIKLMIYVIIVFRVLNGQTISFLQSIAMIGVLRMIEMTIFRFLSPSFVNVKEIIASTDRIKKFLLMEEKMFSDTSPQKVDRINKEILNLKDLTAQWPKPNDGGHPFTIKDIQLNICKGEGVAVVGKVGSGKSTLLQACLDELIVMKGSCKVSGAVAYVPQDPWIMSETVRDNILLGEEYRREKYEAIIRACALEEDLSGFPEGDMTLVGERGLTLSGGQKARVGLARAVYQDADLYLFDDPLSAVDGKVAKKLFFECINGLLKNKARILVTHQLHFIPHIDKVVVLKQGRVLASGEYENVKVIVKENIEVEEKGHKRTLAKLVYDEEQRNDNMEWAKKEQLVYKREDTNEHGGVDNFVYLSYAKAGKGIILLPIFLLLYFASMAVGVFHDWLLVTWSRLRSVEIGNQTVVAGEEYDDTFLEFLNPSANKTAFLIPLGVLIILNLILYMVAFIVLMCMCTLASYNLYNRMFIRLFKAPSHFFETSPVGLILNRFSRDTAFMDIYLIMPLLIAFFASVLFNASLRSFKGKRKFP